MGGAAGGVGTVLVSAVSRGGVMVSRVAVVFTIPIDSFGMLSGSNGILSISRLSNVAFACELIKA